MRCRKSTKPNLMSTTTAQHWPPALDGGSRNCPAMHIVRLALWVLRLVPSMEGRAIARPNALSGFFESPVSAILQWRAGQLPGRTCRALCPCRRRSPFNGGPGNCPAEPPCHLRRHGLDLSEGGPSMEGRAIARPNQPLTPRRASTAWCTRLQWRAGQLPGRTGEVHRGVRQARYLQWRAGQLPGRTRRRRRRSRA